MNSPNNQPGTYLVTIEEKGNPDNRQQFPFYGESLANVRAKVERSLVAFVFVRAIKIRNSAP